MKKFIALMLTVFSLTAMAQDESIVLFSSGNYKAGSTAASYLASNAQSSHKLVSILSAIDSETVAASVANFDRNIRGSLVIKVSESALAKEQVSLTMMTLLQGEIEISSCPINATQSVDAISQVIASCIESEIQTIQ